MAIVPSALGRSNGYQLSVPDYGDSLMEWNATTLALISHWTIPNAQEIADGDFGTTPTLVNPPGGPTMVFVTDKNGWSCAFDRANHAAGPVWQYHISSSHDTVAQDAYGGGRCTSRATQRASLKRSSTARSGRSTPR